MEDVVKGFLNELIRRSLVQVADIHWEEVTKCRIHDLLRDLAVKKALEVNFFDIYDPREHSISSLCLRHVIHGQAQRYLSLDLSNLKLRSVMSFDREFDKLSLIKFRNQFHHIYVLYLDSRGDNTSKLPDAIGSMYHLKFLKLGGIRHLPSSIRNLENLQTLDVQNCLISCQLPPETADLVNLRHLLASYSKPLKHINQLTSLQVLRGIRCNQWKDVDPVDLVNLRELRMDVIKKSYSLNNISSLKSLTTLTLWCSNESWPALEFLSSCQKLQKLLLNGRIEKLPPSNPFPNSITMMILLNSELMEDPMPILGMLPNLRDLQLLYRAYEGKEITCSDNSFSQLESLRLDRLKGLIKGLSIHLCPKLKEIPERMKDVERLDVEICL